MKMELKSTCRSSISSSTVMICIFFVIVINKRMTAAGNDSQSNLINTLPGYPGILPFKFETGYISVGESEEVELFYYFIESESDPVRDPLLFWLTGGPGCSGFSALAYEMGPLGFDISDFDGSLPALFQNPYSWTKIASIIFIDSPAGTGFSYATTFKGYATSDTKTARDNYTFLRKWLMNHPQYIKNRFYVGGDSYAGKFVPMLALEIDKGNEAGLEPQIMLKGYMVGNPVTDEINDGNEKIPYAHRMALVSDQYFELARSSCDGEYANPDPNNYQCIYALQLVKQCTKLINEKHILEPKCKFLSPEPNDDWHKLLLQEDIPDDFLLMSTQEEPLCRTYNYAPSYTWTNDKTVQEALGVREGTITGWKRCNHTIGPFDSDVKSVVYYHQLLNNKGYQALAYSGDHDMVVPYMSTLKWIKEFNLTVDDAWRPWTVNGQVAGYTEKYKKNDAYITFATVKGAGHTAPEYKPKQCFAMAKRWLSESTL